MDKASAEKMMAEIQKSYNRTHLGTTTFRKGVIQKLSKDPACQSDGSVALLELHLTEPLPDMQFFCGVFDADDLGIWYYDGDGSIEEPVRRQRVIFWRYIKSMVLHKTT